MWAAAQTIYKIRPFQYFTLEEYLSWTFQVGNVSPESLGYLNRVRQRNSLGPSRDGNNFAVVHCTGYIKNWPPQGIQMDRNPEDEMHASSSCCLVAIGRLQVTSTPNSGDLNSENNHEFVSRHSLEGKTITSGNVLMT